MRRTSTRANITRALLATPTRRGMVAGALGGLVLSSMFLQAHGESLHRYALNRGNPFVGYLIVWILAIGIGALFGRYLGAAASADLGYALSRGLLVGLGWFVLAACLLLPVLRGTHPFALSPSVGGEIASYLVYGLLLGVGYYQLPELLAAPTTQAPSAAEPAARPPRQRPAGTARPGQPRQLRQPRPRTGQRG
ncbi:MAG TPA: hypothetical protein VFY89_01730 [Ktedonobacterales bacterium]